MTAAELPRAGTAGGRENLRVIGLHCADCARRLEGFLRQVPGVVSADVSFAVGRVVLVTSSPEGSAAARAKARELGYTLLPVETGRGPLSLQARVTIAAVAGLLLGLLAGWTAGPQLSRWAYTAAALLGGIPIFRAALAAVRGRRITVDVLVSLAVGTALITGEGLAAAEVVILMGVGRLLEDATIGRARRSVRSLLELAPNIAWRRRGDRDEQVPCESLIPGDLVIVRPGGRIPVDGTVVEGLAGVDEAPITGEARVRTKGPGDAVFAGSLAQDGALLFRAEKVGQETTIARMAELVEEAQMRRAPVARQVDRFAAAFVPLVLAVAAAVLAVTGEPGRAVTILIGACPCALVLSTPVAVYAAIGAASKRGMLIKGGTYLERLGRAAVIALDKTGTLTSGELSVAEVFAGEREDEGRLLGLAAAVEELSEHHSGRAIVREAASRGLPVLRAGHFEAVAGAGVRGTVSGRSVQVGAARWIAESGANLSGEILQAARRAEARGLSAVIVATDGVARGIIALADCPRSDAARAVQRLAAMGLRVVVLSGDAPQAVARTAERLGVADYCGGLLPGDKVEAIRRLAERGPTAMVGDGINDAPALAAASVGIAVGRSGNDLAIEAADVVLLADDLTRIPELVEIGRRALANIRVNLVFSGLAIAGMIGAAALGLVGPALGALVHEGSAMVVTLNAMRLLRARPQEAPAGGDELGPHECRSTTAAAGGR